MADAKVVSHSGCVGGDIEGGYCLIEVVAKLVGLAMTTVMLAVVVVMGELIEKNMVLTLVRNIIYKYT